MPNRIGFLESYESQEFLCKIKHEYCIFLDQSIHHFPQTHNPKRAKNNFSTIEVLRLHFF